MLETRTGHIGHLVQIPRHEAGTAAAILSVLVLPLVPVLVLLPVVGLMLNGTSSVLYGTVPELAPSGRTERAFAIFYTGTIGAGWTDSEGSAGASKSGTRN